MPRVLVVDDDPMVCVAIEACLQRQGFEVTIADGGEAGMQALETADFLPMSIELDVACCLRKPLTPNTRLTSVNECLTKSIQSARLSKR